MKRKFILVLILSMLTILMACNFSGSEDVNTEDDSNNKSNEVESNSTNNNDNGQTTEQVLNVIEEDEIASLDILLAHDSISNSVIANTTEGLYRLDQNHEPVLAAASDHEVSEDGLVHTFTLRDNVWSNGDPVTAHDFEYSWKRTLQEVGYYSYYFDNANVLNAKEIMEGEKSPDELGVKAIDDKTLELTLSGPSPLLKNSLGATPFFPVNKDYVESMGEEYGTEYDKTLYNGPFVLTNWQHDQGWQYKKNSDYRAADSVKLEEINVSVVKEESTAVNLYEAGDLDQIEITSAFIDRYQDDPNYISSVTAGLKFLRFNHNHEALKNKNIRRALDFAWDKPALTDVILKNGSVPTYYLVPDIAKAPSGESFRSLNGDFTGTIEEAQEYWQKGLDEIGKDTVEVGLLTADETDYKATAEYLKNQWETNLEGLEVTIVLQPFQARLDLEKAIDYDISISSYSPTTPDPLNYLDMWVTGKSFNRMDYSNPEYDELVNAAWAELDEEKRYEIMLEAEQILFEDAAIGPMYQDAVAIINQPYVKGVVHHPSGTPTYDYNWAYIER